MSAAMPWAEDAACKDSKLDFIMEPSGGIEQPNSAVLRLEVCAVCPVRRECLTYALQAEFGAMGVWGGSTMTERRLLMHRGPERLFGEDWAASIEETASFLEDTFAARMNGWRELGRRYSAKRAANLAAKKAAEVGTMVPVAPSAVTATTSSPAGCARCGARFSWRQRSDARYCSGACRQADYRARAAA